MKTLQLSDATAKRLYQTAAPELKTVFEETYGKEFFSQKITDRVKTFEDASNVLGIDKKIYQVHLDIESKDAVSIIAYSKLCIIACALNEGWNPDWSNSNESKYVPWFKANKSGSGLSYFDYDYWITFTGVGSRLCFKTAELAKYAGEQFIDIYNDFLTIK